MESASFCQELKAVYRKHMDLGYYPARLILRQRTFPFQDLLMSEGVEAGINAALRPFTKDTSKIEKEPRKYR